MNQLVNKILSVSPFYKKIEGGHIQRKEPCSMCGSLDATRVGTVDFWDLQQCELVICNRCRFGQLDPKLTDETTDTGCTAKHFENLAAVPAKEHLRNDIRNYRRGYLFGRSLKKKNITPERILEFGPGTGYFTAGLQSVFPDAQVTVADVVDEVLELNEKVHGFDTIKGSPDNLTDVNNQFDLIIARDIIEHVNDFSKMMENINKLLKKGGYFHFLTPNGHADMWKFYVHEKLADGPAELLINHVNYFEGEGLKAFLEKQGFEAVEYYTYMLKNTFRGRGWKMRPENAAKRSRKASSGEMIKNNRHLAEKQVQLKKEEVLKEWYLSVPEWLKYLYIWMQHYHLLRISPGLNIGHEISGLFKKTGER